MTEIEAKFLHVDFAALREKLKALGATRTQPMRLMRRAIIATPEMQAENSFVRIRDEGDKVTVTHKRVHANTVDGTEEVEIVVSDFDTALQLFTRIGLPHRSFQESKRETWELDGVEIVLDEWPWLTPYIEIESDSEAAVRETAEKLGFSWDDAVFGGVMSAYCVDYPHLSEADTVASIEQVRFGDPLPELLIAD